jgi:hypothetical protein
MEQAVKFKMSELVTKTNAETNGLSLDVLGEVTPVPFISRKNGFVETPLREFLGYIKEPARLKDVPDPLCVGTLMYGSDVLECSFDYEDEIVDYLCDSYKNCDARVYDVERAINKNGLMDALNLHTSAGYPLCVLGCNKQDFISNNDGVLSYRQVNDRVYLQECVDSWRNSASDVFWISTLKDELLKPGKLARVFEVPPMAFTIATRCYFGSWIEMMHGNCLNSFSCVGINPESDQWTRLFYKLSEMSIYGIDADVSGWDKSLQPYVLDIALKSVNRWYEKNDPEWKHGDNIARRNLLNGMVHGLIVVGPVAIQKHKGMASGWVLTALFNTVCNMIQHLVWFMESVPVEYKDVSFYDKCVVTALYGDDSLDAIREDMLVYLNRKTMAKVYKRFFTMDVTSSGKTDELIEVDKIVDLQFLKRNFRVEGAVVKPLLDPLSVFSMLGFVRSSKYVTEEDQLKLNLEMAARAMYFYGPDAYGKYCAWLAQIGLAVKFPKYAYFDRNFVGGNWEVYDFTFN